MLYLARTILMVALLVPLVVTGCLSSLSNHPTRPVNLHELEKPFSSAAGKKAEPIVTITERIAKAHLKARVDKYTSANSATEVSEKGILIDPLLKQPILFRVPDLCFLGIKTDANDVTEEWIEDLETKVETVLKKHYTCVPPRGGKTLEERSAHADCFLIGTLTPSGAVDYKLSLSIVDQNLSTRGGQSSQRIGAETIISK